MRPSVRILVRIEYIYVSLSPHRSLLFSPKLTAPITAPRAARRQTSHEEPQEATRPPDGDGAAVFRHGERRRRGGEPPLAGGEEAGGGGWRRRRRVRPAPRRHRPHRARQARRRSRVPCRRRLGGAHVQEVPGARGAPGGAVACVGGGRRGAMGRVVGGGAPVLAAVRGRRQPPRLLLPRHGEILLPREQGDGRGSAGARGGRRPRTGAVRAGGGAVQRQRRRQGGQGPARGSRAVRPRRVARPHPGAPRARPLPPGRLRRPPRRPRRTPPSRPRRRARAPLLEAQVQTPLRPRRRQRRRGRGQPVHGRLVGVTPRQDGGAGMPPRRRRRRGRRLAALLARAVRAAGDAAARVPAVLGVWRCQLLLARVPGARLEARPPSPVRRRALARRGRRRRALSATRRASMYKPLYTLVALAQITSVNTRFNTSIN